jgi:hypothetical protein
MCGLLLTAMLLTLLFIRVDTLDGATQTLQCAYGAIWRY